MKKILLITSLLFISCIYAQQQQVVNSLRLDRRIYVDYDGYSIRGKKDWVYGNGITTLLDYSYQAGSFRRFGKYEYTYDTSGNLTSYLYYIFNRTVPSNKYDITYDADGNETLRMSYFWNTDTQSFVPIIKVESTYDDKGNKTFSIEYSWSNTSQSFDPNKKNENTYDSNGNQTLSINYSWNTTTESFIPNDKNENTFDANGNETLRMSYSWNTDTQSFVPRSKGESNYDAKGNRTSYINHFWNDTTQSLIQSTKWEFSFDTDGNINLEMIYNWNTTTQSFVPIFKIVSSYTDGFIASFMFYKWYSELGVYKPSFKTEWTTILDTDTQLDRMGVSYQYDTNFNIWKELEGEEFKSYEYYTKTELSTQTIDNDLISLYPNPTSKLLYVSNPKLNSLGIQIVDLNGKQMYSGTIQKDVPLDISSYSLGMYLVTIENKETKKKNTYKIIKK